jgi:hypothetical protein
LRTSAQQGNSAAGIPDVIVGDIPNVLRQGSLGTETAYSLATTSCNIGSATLDWLPSPDPRHPVITQNLYRVRDGRIEQLGVMSWLKHGFSVVPGSVCATCQDTSHFDRLPVNCSDPYSAGLNGSQNGLGPRSEINAATGSYVLPFTHLPTPRTVVDGRLRVANADLEPANNSGARYFVESQYIHPQDAAAGNGTNNASHREAFVERQPGGELELRLNASSPTVRKEPGILAWRRVNSDVQYLNVDVPNDGRFIIGIRHVAQPSGAGSTIVAVQNINSHRSARYLNLHFASGAVSNPGFHDIAYQHEPYSATDWSNVITSSDIKWSTESFATNQNANALRWGTMYTFWCDSSLLPDSLELGLFRPGSPDSINVNVPHGSHSVATSLEPAADWALVESSINLGNVPHGKIPSFAVSCRYGVERNIKAVDVSNKLLKAKASKSAGSESGSWKIDLTPEENAPSGYFESIVTLKTDNPSDQAVPVRVFGELQN